MVNKKKPAGFSDCRERYLSRQFLFFCLPKGLLISAPGASLSAGVPGSLLSA
jgi:hypothetical protein